MLGGCSLSSSDVPMSLNPPPVNYHSLVATNVDPLKGHASAAFEISPLRKTRSAQPGDWFVCVRTIMQDRPAYFAVFLAEDRVIERRQAVAIDECARESYQPFPRQ
jgi:hypothetical protein